MHNLKVKHRTTLTFYPNYEGKKFINNLQVCGGELSKFKLAYLRSHL